MDKITLDAFKIVQMHFGIQSYYAESVLQFNNLKIM